MLRNPAYRGQAAFGKTHTTGERAKPTRPVRARGERHGRRETRRDLPREQWTSIPVPALITDETFELAQVRLQENKRHAKRNSREPALLKGILVCRDCGYACWRTSARTTKRLIYYYRCIGSDNYRHVGGRVCSNRPIRADELDALVWGEVERLLSDPALIRAEIDRRLQALRAEHPAAHRRHGLERELARVRAGSGRLIEAYQEQLITLEELRTRMPALRKRETTLAVQLDALDAELHDAETYLKLAENLEDFLARLAENAKNLTIQERQRVLHLVVREVRIGDDGITIRHSIPTPSGGNSPDCLLRGSGPYAVTRARLAGYRAALSREGIDWDEVPVYECPSSRQSQAAARQLLAASSRPTALLATSDALARGALKAAEELGIPVPADLSVVGFDDSPGAGRTNPPLTTVRQPHVAKGQRAGELLLKLIAGEAAEYHELLDTELIVRGSTSRAHAGRRKRS